MKLAIYDSKSLEWPIEINGRWIAENDIELQEWELTLNNNCAHIMLYEKNVDDDSKTIMDFLVLPCRYIKYEKSSAIEALDFTGKNHIIFEVNNLSATHLSVNVVFEDRVIPLTFYRKE